MFDLKNEESFVYTKFLKLLAFAAAISLILVLIFDDKLVIFEEVFRFTAIICQAVVLIIINLIQNNSMHYKG